MKIRAIVVSTLILCSLCMAILYVRAAQEPNTNRMITQAIQSKDTPMVIKTLIEKMKRQMEVNTDDFPLLIKEVEQYTATCTDSASVAVLHSMLAEMYNKYLSDNRWKIAGRTNLSGYVPEDIQVWTLNLFQDKIKQEIKASLQPARLLQQTPISEFDPILIQGKDTPKLRPTLFDFLSFRALNIDPSVKIYQDLIDFRNTQPDKEAAMMATLDYLNYLYGATYSPTNTKRYEASLDSLLHIYGKEDYSVEIMAAQLNLMSTSNSHSSNTDSIQTAIYQLCTNGIKRFPHYDRIGLLKNKLKELERPRLQIEIDNNVYPGKKLNIQVNYTHVPRITIAIYKNRQTPQQAFRYINKTNLGELVRKQSYTLPMQTTYIQKDTTFRVPMDTPGSYVCVVTAGEQQLKTNINFSVSRLAALSRENVSGEMEIVVADFLTGKPIPDATVHYYKEINDSIVLAGSVRTDKEGLGIVPKQKQIRAYQATRPGDESSFLTRIFPYGKAIPETKGTPRVALFTDRGLYRPGQTVFFKGIAYVEEENPKLITNKSFQVNFRYPNRQLIASKTFTSNSFGSFNGEFTIPEQGLSGEVFLECENIVSYFRVEEYKRPTFRVKIMPIKKEITFGDLVTLQGEAQTFSGVSLQGGNVDYRIVRYSYLTPLGFFDYSGTQVAEGKAMVNNQGNFSFDFRPEAPEQGRLHTPFYQYEAIVTLTDSKGETQEARYSFVVGKSSILLTTNLTNQMEKDTVNAIVKATTLNGEPVSVEGTYSIYSLIESDKGDNPPSFRLLLAGTIVNELDENLKFEKGPLVASGTFTSGMPIDKKVFSELPSGCYRIELKANDSQGKSSEQEQDFILFGLKDKRPPIYMHTWLVPQKIVCKPGEEAEFIFGTSDKEAYILYEIFAGGNCVSRKRIVLNDENRTFHIPYLESYPASLSVIFTFIKNGELYSKQLTITRMRPDRRLTIKPETFRDHLLPGKPETWKFRILKADSLPATAEVLASMYDASLDKIAPFIWNFTPYPGYEYTYNPRFNQSEAFFDGSRFEDQKIRFINVPAFQFDRLNWEGVLENRFANQLLSATMPLQMRSAASAPQKMKLEDQEESSFAGDIKEDKATGTIPEQGNIQVPLRQNFNETAFFYPSLLTDKNGDVTLNFTMPESNTTWKLQMLANTEELDYGQLVREVVTSKPLMVLPNLPRFMRQGDEVSISTQVINQTDTEIKGRVSLELLDPQTEQPIVCLTKTQKPFELGTDSTTTVSWTVTVPSTINLLICRIIADSDHGTDGEQHLIPVLSNQLLITESTPFYLLEPGEKQIQLPSEKSSADYKPFRLTLELTANPIWYAVQALPTLSLPDNENIISWFGAYYSNTLAYYIAASHPRIHQIIDQWKAQGGTANTLYSNLEKNAELKNILLQETPWVLAAENETEQKQRLSLLFDLNRAATQRETAFRQLQQQQNREGGWSWFKNLPASREITLYILKGMSQLTELNAIEYNQEEKEMQIKALQFLDKQIAEDYTWLQKTIKKGKDYSIHPSHLDYLYVRSAYRDIPEWGGAREAIRFYTSLAQKQWQQQSLYGKGETALLMYRNGQKEVANQILAWLRKTATTSTEKGMYWANNRRGDQFFVSPVDVHCLLMSVFNQIAPNQQETNRMKQWLLNQKRTQNWESVPATVNAIYALLLTGSDWLDTQNTCTITWGKQTFSTSEGETATGYLKVVVSDEKELATESRQLSIRKEGKAPAWGAVYNQYFENINQVKKQEGILSVEKKLFVEINQETGQQIRPVSPEHPLRVGDKVIVRLVIRTDREMDYVSLKDLRAGCFESANPLSGATYRDGVWYYQSPTDVSENFFFNRLPQGTYVLEYPVYVARTGEYAGGISTIQCLYAPEFVSHTEGKKIKVEPF